MLAAVAPAPSFTILVAEGGIAGEAFEVVGNAVEILWINAIVEVYLAKDVRLLRGQHDLGSGKLCTECYLQNLRFPTRLEG